MSPDTPAGGAVMALLIFATVVCVLSSIGLLAMKGFYNKLHYLAPPAILATTAIAAAILVQEGFKPYVIKPWLVLAVLVITNPILTYAAARAKHMRDLLAEGKQQPTAEDKEQVTKEESPPAHSQDDVEPER